MPRASAKSSFMNGIPELLILRVLARGEMYGYDLVRAIREQTEQAINLGEGVVYPTLHALEVAGALKSKRKTVNGRSRVYYAITPAGSRRLTTLVGTWTQLASAIQGVLGGPRHAPGV